MLQDVIFNDKLDESKYPVLACMVFDFFFEKKIKFDWKKKSNFLCMVFDVFFDKG